MYILLIFQILFVVLIYITAGKKYEDYKALLCRNQAHSQNTNVDISENTYNIKTLSIDDYPVRQAPTVYTQFYGNKVYSYFLPAGLHLFKLLNHKFCSKYERKLEYKIKPLVGPGQARTFLEIHMAIKVMILIFTTIFLTFVATQKNIDLAYGLFCFTIIVLLFYLTDKQLDKQIKERKQKMQLEFPDFLNKLVLLIDAGLTIQAAIRKIVKDNRKSNPLYTELFYTINEINTGKSESQAFEMFARRCAIHEITLFTATMLQNIKKGSSEIVPLLRVQAAASWESRKNIARKLGEEASTKLILPMIMMFIAVLIMIITPAIFQLNF